MSTSLIPVEIKKEQSMPKLEIVPLTLKKYPKLIITKEFQNIFEYFCNENKTVEWSGVMYYRVEGDLTNISEMVITPVDILLMDIGTSGHTEFQYSTDVITYSMNRGLFECGTGLIHSHNNMNVFFSGEDNSELNDIAPLFTYYVSVIVNNRSEIDAKLAFVVNVNSNVAFNATLDKSVEHKLMLQETKKLATVNFEIVREANTQVDSIYQLRLSEVRAEIASKKAAAYKPTPYINPLAGKPTKNRNSALSITDADLYGSATYNNSFNKSHHNLFSDLKDIDTAVPEIDEKDIINFIADLVQEDGVEDLNVIIENLVMDTTIKVGDIKSNIEEEFDTVFELNFGDLEATARQSIIDKAIELLQPYARKLKGSAIIQALKNQ